MGNGGDGDAATAAELYKPYCVVVDASGNVYIGCVANIRKVNNTGVISTFAGTGTVGYSGENGPATLAEISAVSDIFIDATSNLYIADADNNRIRKIDISGTITTVVGTGASLYNGDGIQATSANIYHPAGVVMDNSGNLYLTEYHHFRIRKVSSDGIITTVAGNGLSGFSADGTAANAAQIQRSIGIRTDNAGNVYYSETFNNRVCKINASGYISTVAGNGSVLFDGDGIPATAARIGAPVHIAFDAGSNMLICDFSNNRIRRVSNAVAVPQYGLQNASVAVYPNPARSELYFRFPRNAETVIKITDFTGRTIAEQHVQNADRTTVNIKGATPGMYMYQIVTKKQVHTGKVVIAE